MIKPLLTSLKSLISFISVVRHLEISQWEMEGKKEARKEQDFLL